MKDDLLRNVIGSTGSTVRIWIVDRDRSRPFTSRSWHAATRFWRVGVHLTIHRHGSHIGDRWVFQSSTTYDRKRR